MSTNYYLAIFLFAGVVEDVTVVGCCRVMWRPPRDTGGERPGYAIRFFDGETYSSSDYKRIVRSFDDPDRTFVTMADCPTDRVIYADVSTYIQNQ